MFASTLRSSRIYAIENSLAAFVFAFLLIAHCAAVLLYLHPNSELIWALSLQSNRLASPILGAFDLGFGKGPAITFIVLVFLTLAPLLAWRLRHRLLTAIAGHLALGICIVLTSGAVQRASYVERTASLTPFGQVPPLDSNSVCLASITFAMICLCLINHAMFFRSDRQS